MNDVMWATPDNRRVLIAPTKAIADFVSAVYRFDEVLIAPVDVDVTNGGKSFEVAAGPLRMKLEGSWRVPVPLGVLRSPAFTRFVESPIARATMKLRTYGKTPSGMEEWYRVDGLRYLKSAEAWNDGISLGTHARIEPPLNMGVSDPPRRGSIVSVRPLIRDASGKLAEALGQA